MEIGSVKIIDIDKEMRTAYLNYAMSVIVSRALPDVRDGLKPVHRRILFSMNENGVHHTAKYRKSARIVGDVLGKYHPHGDTAVYDAMVRMAQDFSLRYPLIDGQGNFGSLDDDPAAHMRYTEARMAAIADEILQDINKNTVEFSPNYDGSQREPNVLPAKLPNLLLNGASGIAVGMATNIPPHNLRELADGIIMLIENPETTVDELMTVIPGPDFPTGGIIMGTEGIKHAYATGKGRLLVRAKVFIEEQRNHFNIIISEIPFMVNKASLQEKISDLVKEGKLDGISAMRDESDRSTGVRVLIELKRDAQPKKVLNNLFKFTQMQTTFGVNMLALVDGIYPRVLPLKRILQYYIDWRHEVITRRTQFELDQARKRAHILEGLKIALDNLDAVITTIRQSKSSAEARPALIARFNLSDAQAQAILDLQLGRLAALERQRLEDEYRDLLKQINFLEDLLANPRKIQAIIKKDLKDLKDKYGDDRRTRISNEDGSQFSDSDLIPDLNVLVTVTDRGYIKRVPPETYRRQRRGGKGVIGQPTREQDVVEHMISCGTLDSLLFFTNRGRVFQLKVHEVPDASRTAKGLPLINLISLSQGELVTGILAVADFEDAKYLAMATKQGKIKRTLLEEYSAVRANGLIAMGLEDGDELCWVRMSQGNGEILMSTAQGQVIRFAEEEVRAMGRPASGVNGIRLDPGDVIVGMDLVQEDADLLLVTANGIGKRTPLHDFPAKGRYTGGVIGIKTTPKGGLVVCARVIHENDDLMFISTSGLVIRTAARDISQLGRAAQGVNLMTLRAKDQIASLARVDASVIESIEGDEDPAAAIEGEPVALQMFDDLDEVPPMSASDGKSNGLKPVDGNGHKES